MRPPASVSPSLRELLREDFETHDRALLSAGFQALAVHRIGTSIAGNPRRGSRWLMRVYRRVAAFVTAAYGIELPLGVQIGRRLALPHPQGVVFGYGSCIGDDCMVRHNVTLGAASHERDGMPTVGDRVQFGPGSIVMGAVEVGDDVRIGPGAVVISDVPAGSRVLAPVATVVPPRSVSDPVRPEPLRPTAPVLRPDD